MLGGCHSPLLTCPSATTASLPLWGEGWAQEPLLGRVFWWAEVLGRRAGSTQGSGQAVSITEGSVKKDFLGRFLCIIFVLSSSLRLFQVTSYPGYLALSSLVGGDGEPLFGMMRKDFMHLFQLCALASLNPMGSAMTRSWFLPGHQQFCRSFTFDNSIERQSFPLQNNLFSIHTYPKHTSRIKWHFQSTCHF